MTKLTFVFPGQGSQSVGMMADWNHNQSIVNNVYNQASEALGYDLWGLVSKGTDSELNKTEVTQPAMLCAGVATWRIIQQSGEFATPQLMAGHSLGEYTALVCSQSIELSSAVKLVARRGALMQSAVAAGEGSMAAIIGLTDEDVIRACGDVETGIVEAVNFNAPGQVVIAGNKHAVGEAMENAKSLGAKRALPLPVSVPSHCSLMQPAAEKLADELEKVTINIPTIPVIHNQNAGLASSTDEIRDLLKRQLYQPVKWVESIQKMHAQGIEHVIECGPGKVLSGLTRRIDKSMRGYAVFDAASLEKTIDSFTE
ncbi:MAG: ACP S-malonyltransferase [Gammaproteobacteria bacterium]|nr:ACP S-malonyltransferase [Gammaproteobacteria bacterium]